MRALIHAHSRRPGYSPPGWIRNAWCMRTGVRALGPARAPHARSIRTDLLFIRSGVYGRFGMTTRNARPTGIRMGSFVAGGYGDEVLACNGISLHDLPAAFNAPNTGCAANSCEPRFALDSGLADMTSPRAWSDTFASQTRRSHRINDCHDASVPRPIKNSMPPTYLIHADRRVAELAKSGEITIDCTDRRPA